MGTRIETDRAGVKEAYILVNVYGLVGAILREQNVCQASIQ